MPSIFVKDDLRASVEAASGGKQTVLYTASGQPSVMNVIPAFSLQDIDAGLGSGLHPAFIVGGVQKSEIFIGSYQGAIKNGELLSLPGVDPSTDGDHDAFVIAARAAGPGWHCMTNAEWAAIALWCWKNGYQPRGNTRYGKAHDSLWETARRADGKAPGLTTEGGRTLAGSGPASWRHDNTPAGIADLCGNIWEWAPGMRLMDGEIQVIANNDAALAGTDLSRTSTAWRAIKASDGALVAPGSTGTLKYDSTGAGSGHAQLSDVVANRTGTVGDDGAGSFYTVGTFESAGAKSGITVPALAKALGLYPVAAAGLQGDGIYVSNHGERLPIRGGDWVSGADAGVFAIYLSAARAAAYSYVGSRPAFVL